MGTTHGKRILRGNIMGTLPLPRSIHHRHPPHTYVQHSFLQTQIPYDAILNTSRCPHPSSRQSHDCTCRSDSTSQHDHRRHCTTRQHFQDASRKRKGRGNTSKGAHSGRMHKLKGCSTRRMHKLKECATRQWWYPFLPRQKLQTHIHHSRLKNIPKWMLMLAHYEEHQSAILKTTPTRHDRQTTHVTSARFEQSHRTTYFT